MLSNFYQMNFCHFQDGKKSNYNIAFCAVFFKQLAESNGPFLFQDIDQFVNAANAVVADLAGAHAVLADDVSSGTSNPALVLLAGSEDTLVSVADALGVSLDTPA